MNKHCPVRRQDHVITFRKWRRKGYSVFQSLHKTIRIGYLSVGYLLFAIPANAQKNMMIAPHDSINALKGVEMEEVVVSAQRAPVTFSQVARILNVIEKDEIQRAPVQSIQDLLEYAIGVDIRQRGGLGVQSDVSIRGSSFDQVLILLNGININDPQTGHHNLNLPVSLDAIERIEILEGPSSRIYGLNAFSGAINFITGTGSNSNIRANLSGGQFGFWDGSLSGSLVKGKFSNLISVDHRSSDGYIKNTDFNLTDSYYKAKLSGSAANIELQAGHSGRAFGSNSFYTPVYPDQFEKTSTTFASLKMESGKKIHFTPTIYWRRNQDRFELFRYSELTPAWYKRHNYHLTDVYGSNLNIWFASALGKTAAGLEFRNENIWSTVLGKPLGSPKAIPGEKDKFFTFGDLRNNFSFFLEHSFYLNDFSLSAGLMANRNSTLNDWFYSPGVDISWDILKQQRTKSDLKWYGSFNKSLRMPTFTDLYYSSPTNIGNPDLKPEEATAFESGLKFTNPALHAHISYFKHFGVNIIDWVHLPEETVWKSQNLTTLTTDGIEVAAKIKPGMLIDNPHFIKSMYFSFNWLDQGKESGSLISKYVMDYLRYKLLIGITHSVIKKVGADWQISWQERNGTYTKWEGSAYGSEIPYKPLWLMNAKVFWQGNKTFVYMEIANLLDQKYADYGNVAQPGRWIKFGIRKQIDL